MRSGLSCGQVKHGEMITEIQHSTHHSSTAWELQTGQSSLEQWPRTLLLVHQLDRVKTLCFHTPFTQPRQEVSHCELKGTLAITRNNVIWMYRSQTCHRPQAAYPPFPFFNRLCCWASNGNTGRKREGDINSQQDVFPARVLSITRRWGVIF